MIQKQYDAYPLIVAQPEQHSPLSIEQLTDQAHLLATNSDPAQAYAGAMRQVEHDVRP